MSPTPSRLWLAREHEVHGPYDMAQIFEMDARNELFPEDHFCREGEDFWFGYQEWRSTARKKTIIKASQHVLTHTERVTIDQKRRNSEMTSRFPSHPTQLRNRQFQSLPQEEDTPDRRLARMVACINDHRREKGHEHPLHFVEEEKLVDAIKWLDSHHPEWERRSLSPVGSNFKVEVLNKWLIPALAHVHPDLIKSSHLPEFQRGTRWQLPR